MTRRDNLEALKMDKLQRIRNHNLREVWKRWEPERPELLMRLYPKKESTPHATR